MLPTSSSRNVLVFVADGLRPGSVNPIDAPTMYSLLNGGVSFTNSHSLFPTFTTPNASAIATGHYLGDTGDFSNTIYAGYPAATSGGSPTPFIENNPVLGELNTKYPGAFDPSDPDTFSFYSFLNEETLLQAARLAGYNTAAVGKVGPTLIQDVSQGTPNPSTGLVPVPQTVIIDDSTGKTGGIPLSSDIQQRLIQAGIGITAPDRSNGASTTSQLSNGFSGNNTTPGTLQANYVQQQYFTNAVTQAILPEFQANGNPFAMVYWSRDPDGTQHNQGDSLNSLTPGINGPTSRAAVKNADSNLAQIIAELKTEGLYDNTDIFITSDHGFSTISKSVVDAQGTRVNDYASTLTYTGVNPGFLPVGFVAIDLAHGLGENLFDPDQATKNADNTYSYTLVDPTKGTSTKNGNGLIASSTTLSTPNGTTPPPADVIIAANGGSDLVYIPDHNAATLQKVVDILTKENYVSGLFVDDSYGSIAGTLPLSAINLKGDAQTPTPAIVINFKTFSTDPSNPFQTQVEIADTGLQQGQGMHGSFGRGDTFNNMIAFGPDFKQGYVDNAPVSNADIAPTLASILGLGVPSNNGNLTGRVISEALVGGPDSVDYTSGTLRSDTALNGQRTYLNYQQVGDTKYFDAAGFANGTVGLNTGEKHVLLLSIDGLREADLTDPNLQAYIPNILALAGAGVQYTGATTSSPSDSFPGLLSYLTGAGPATTGVYYDDSYDYNLFGPDGTPGTEVQFAENIDKNPSLLSGGGDFGVGSIDISQLPLDADGNPVFPHQYVQVNNIFDIAHAAGLYTAYSDKHPGAYDIVNGQSGNAVDDYYSPEINAKVAIDPATGKLIDASNNPNNLPLATTTTSVKLTDAYDNLKVQAILNEIKGLNSRGTDPAEVPNLFGMNFQAVSVGQKVLTGGISANGTPSADFITALKNTDQSIGEIINALKQTGEYDSTLVVLTAKHGQNPRIGSASLVKDNVFTNALEGAGIKVAQATQDDIALLWLDDPNQAAAAAQVLKTLQQSSANPGIANVFYGDSLAQAGFGDPSGNRTPTLIVQLDPGVVLVGNPATATKQAEHGGLSPDDLNVGLIVGGGLVSSDLRGQVVSDSVSTKQIAVTTLNALGLDASQLQGAAIENTQALPDLGSLS
jgi:predicted AlkP superfamily pyrophosphatase or phosphodiesterase